MLMLLSPAKSLDMDRTLANSERTLPRFVDATQQLVTILKACSPGDLRSLMSLSDKLATLNAERYQAFSSDYTEQNSSPAAAAFDGDVYTGLDAATLSTKELSWAQSRLRILSGLYGLLRPLDTIQPYRLEMGTRLVTPRGEDLYDFWGDMLARAIEVDAAEAGAEAVINLASNEYSKAAGLSTLDTLVLTPVFKERKDGATKIISFYAKKARGTMARWIIQNQLDDPNALVNFAEDGYRFEGHHEDTGELLYVRG